MAEKTDRLPGERIDATPRQAKDSFNADRSTAAEEEWIKLTRSMTDESLAHKLRLFDVDPDMPPATLRALGALAFVRARRLTTTETTGKQVPE